MKYKLKAFPFREYEDKIEEIKKACKKLKITKSEFVRESNQRSLDLINHKI